MATTVSRTSTSAFIGALFVVLAAASSTRAGAAEPRRPSGERGHVDATMQCDRVAEPGRVKCSIELRPTDGRVVAWADVAVLELPDFMAALKGRIGPADATAREPDLQRWAFGLVAKRAGQGEAKARVRAVLCEPAASDAGPEKCVPVTVEVRGAVHVG